MNDNKQDSMNDQDENSECFLQIPSFTKTSRKIIIKLHRVIANYAELLQALQGCFAGKALHGCFAGKTLMAVTDVRCAHIHCTVALRISHFRR